MQQAADSCLELIPYLPTSPKLIGLPQTSKFSACRPEFDGGDAILILKYEQKIIPSRDDNESLAML